MTPWQYLDNLVRSDRGPEHGEDWMTARLQISWPGNYRVKYTKWDFRNPYYIEFDNPADETMFRLKYA